MKRICNAPRDLGQYKLDVDILKNNEIRIRISFYQID